MTVKLMNEIREQAFRPSEDSLGAVIGGFFRGAVIPRPGATFQGQGRGQNSRTEVLKINI